MEEQPLKPILNEKLKARAIAVTQSVLCSSMIFHCILRTNSMDNSPSIILSKTLAREKKRIKATRKKT
jgi:hypothetical protein